jgi:hypothetical protein
MNDGKWAPGTGIIIFLLLIIAAKLHAFDGLLVALTSPTTVTVVLAIGLGLFAIVVVWLILARIFRGAGGVWNGIPEPTRFLGLVWFLITLSTVWFVYHGIYGIP